MGQEQSEKSPIGMNEVLAVGLGVAALWRIRNRRKRDRARADAERAAQEQPKHDEDEENPEHA